MRDAALCSLLMLTTACAQIAENVTLRAQGLEPARVTRVETGKGLGVSGARQGNVVQAQVFDVTYCAQESRQRARGFRRTERRAVGPSLKLEWLFGGLFTATAGAIVAYQVTHPPEPPKPGELSGKSSPYPFAAGIGAVGLALLAGATVQSLRLGVQEEDLGERELQHRSREQPCARVPAHGGRVRLTLADGLQLEADAGPDGAVVLPLPEDVEQRLQEGRRATLEAMGDPRAQERIAL